LNVIDTLTGDVYYSEASYDLNVEPLEQPYMLSPDTVAVNENITFDASQSAIRSFTIENYYWDFGDGGVENEVKARHRYAKAGTYIVRLGITGTGEAVDEEGQKACASKKILVRRVR
jgi:PKD repeat protein